MAQPVGRVETPVARGGREERHVSAADERDEARKVVNAVLASVRCADGVEDMVLTVHNALAAAERRGAEAALREAAAEIDRMMVADRSSIRRQAFGRAATLVAEMGRGARSGRGR
jgi:hypothetical protein